MGAICPKPPPVEPIVDLVIAEETAIENTTPIFIGTFIEPLEEQYKVKWGSDPQTNTIETQKKVYVQSLNTSQATKKGILKNTNTHLQEELILLTKTISLEYSHEKLARYLKARKSSSHEIN